MPQETRSYAQSSGYAEDLPHDARNWKEAAEFFLQEADDADADRKPVSAMYRQKSLDTLVSWDNILRLVRGRGMEANVDERFKDLGSTIWKPTWPPTVEPPPRDWFWLINDRCQTNLTPLCYGTKQLGLLSAYYSDPNHDPFNEVKTAGHDAGFGDVLKIVVILCNAFLGPWDTQAFHAKAIDGALEAKAKSDENDRIFRWLLPKIAADTDEDDQVFEESFPKRVWDGMGTGKDIMVLGKSMSLCRFGDYQPAYMNLRKVWHKRLYFFLTMMVTERTMKVLDTSMKFTERLKVGRLSGNKTTLAAALAAEVRTQRGASKNTLHFATKALLNNHWRRKADIFYVVTHPAKKAQGMQAKSNVGAEAALEFALGVARGDNFQVALDSLAVFDDPDQLAFMGFKLTFHQVGNPADLTADDLYFDLLHEQEYMTLAMRLRSSSITLIPI